MTHCATCNGFMLPSSFRGEPDACMLCGRSNGPQLTVNEMIRDGLDITAMPRLGVINRGQENHYGVRPFSEDHAHHLGQAQGEWSRRKA